MEAPCPCEALFGFCCCPRCFEFYFIFYKCICPSVCLYSTCVHEPTEVRGECQLPRNWSARCQWACTSERLSPLELGRALFCPFKNNSSGLGSGELCSIKHGFSSFKFMSNPQTSQSTNLKLLILVASEHNFCYSPKSCMCTWERERLLTNPDLGRVQSPQ